MSKIPSLPSLDQLPPPARAAFLLDFDGTLVDIAPTPESVVVAPGLIDTLQRLREKCGNALAVISGRPIEQIDHFLPGVPYAVAGEHGIAIRHAPGQPIVRADLPPVPPVWLEQADRLAHAHPGMRVERKKAGLVLHYRGAPEAGEALGRIADEWVAATNGAFHVQAAKMAWEIRPAGIDKGHAVEVLMQAAPFAGRAPIFVGDDVTDEDGIRMAVRLGGVGLRIPANFPDPDSFRGWLAQLAQGGNGAWGG